MVLGQFTASGNYSSASHQFRLVKPAAGGALTLTTGRGSPVIGVLYNQPTSGAMAQLAWGGVVKVRLSTSAGAVAVGCKIAPSTANNGKADTSTAVGTRYIGHALSSAASGSGAVISVLWAPGVGSSGGETAA